MNKFCNYCDKKIFNNQDSFKLLLPDELKNIMGKEVDLHQSCYRVMKSQFGTDDSYMYYSYCDWY